MTQTNIDSFNPFYKDFPTKYATPPFSSINNTHYEPAIIRGIERGRSEIDRISHNPEPPTFENTIEALDKSDRELDRVLNVFYPLLSAMSDDEMMEISLRVSPLLSDYSTSIMLNRDLWLRVKAVYDDRDNLTLSPEQQMLLKNTYDSFARNGARLEGDDRETYRKLTSRLSELTTRFGQNVLKELNTYEIWLTKEDLDGLNANLIETAAHAASEKGREGEYLFTLEQPTYIAFMKYSSRRDLRERMYRLYCGRNMKGDFSNIEIMKEIADLRRRLAKLLGYENFATYRLEHSMAETPANVYNLLNELMRAYRPALTAELAELTAYAAEIEGEPVELKPWDYSYYANKLKQAKYSYDEEALRPYFELDNVINGVFGLATRLYGIEFKEDKDIEVYHPDVKAFRVTDSDGKYLGVLFTDFFPRASKQPGAWMTEFKPQFIDEAGNDSRPHISIVMNFTKPTADKPSLLVPHEVRTFLHEFGHALHGLLTRCHYSSLSGTSVYRDFVELPSQFNENFLTENEFLNGFARHYKTGEPIPPTLVSQITETSQFGAAYACMRQLNFGLVDMAWHTITAAVDDAAEFEKKAGEPVAIFSPVENTMVSPQFSHIFSGGYAAGYYSYKWAEVLDADAFAAFEENGIFNPATATSFRSNILEKGGSEHPAILYRRFRGHDASIDALLRRDGIETGVAR